MELSEEHSKLIRPNTFRLPKRGIDPYFGLSRSMYYSLEQQGLLNLIRLRNKGKKRGVTLISYAEVEQIIKNARESE